MPLYSYKCTNCNYQFEVRQRFSDEPLTNCPVCAGEVRKVISPVGIVFKGSGFYVTDNRNGKANGALHGSGKADDSKKPEKTADIKKPADGKKATDKSSLSSPTSSGAAS